MPKSSTPLAALVADLERLHGPAPPPFPTRAFELILWENVAYLADDAKRRAAFDKLKKSIGTSPEAISRATPAKLRAVTVTGILPELFAAKLQETARIAIEEFDGDVDAVTLWPVKDAKKALRKFPGIGEPSAEKILLFARGEPFVAPDSNALRVMTRVGISPERKNYSQSYAAARDVAAEQLGGDARLCLAAHQLLRRHGQQICKRSTPLCEQCPVTARCAYFRLQRKPR